MDSINVLFSTIQIPGFVSGVIASAARGASPTIPALYGNNRICGRNFNAITGNNLVIATGQTLCSKYI